jgi:hypothetical protein
MKWFLLWIGLKMLNCLEIICVAGVSKSMQLTPLTCLLRTQTIWPVSQYKLRALVNDAIITALDCAENFQLLRNSICSKGTKITANHPLTCSLRTQIIWPVRQHNWRLFNIVYDVIVPGLVLDWYSSIINKLDKIKYFVKYLGLINYTRF